MASVKSKLEYWTSIRSSFLYLMTLLHDANTFLLNSAFLLLTCSTMWECASRPCYYQDLILILNADSRFSEFGTADFNGGGGYVHDDT